MIWESSLIWMNDQNRIRSINVAISWISPNKDNSGSHYGTGDVIGRCYGVYNIWLYYYFNCIFHYSMNSHRDRSRHRSKMTDNISIYYQKYFKSSYLICPLTYFDNGLVLSRYKTVCQKIFGGKCMCTCIWCKTVLCDRTSTEYRKNIYVLY